MSSPYRRIRREHALAAALIAVMALFGARLVQLQVFGHEQWRAIAVRQSSLTKFQKPTRGEILDRNGVSLAVTLPLTYAVGYRPVYVMDFDGLSAALATVLARPKREIREKLDSPGFAYLARKVDWQVEQKLEALDVACLQFDEEPRRSYPSTTAAATVIGFTDRSGKGVEGIEAAMNDELAGEGYRELCRVDALRKTAVPVSPVAVEYRGANVTLSLDLQLQAIVEEELAAGLRGRVFERACAIMVDPRTGDVLALATLPSFDPNCLDNAAAMHRRCWPVTDVVEPGSVLKIVAIAKALESRRFTRTSRVFCENGAYAVPGTVIHDAHPHGTLTLEQVLALSSNIGAAKVSQQFTPAEIYDKLRAFGFGNPTMIELAGEQPGVIPLPSEWTGPTQSTLAFGQGISCTALQLTLAYAAIANGGLLMKPRLVQSLEFPSGARTTFAPEVIRKVIPASVGAELNDMLVGAVEYGTGTTVKVDGVRIAGKTGTAQKVDQVHKTYYPDRFISSFVGYFPADYPHYVLLVMVDDPRGEHYGALVAGPIFKGIVEEMKVVRPHELSPELTRTPDLADARMSLGREAAQAANVAVLAFNAISGSPDLHGESGDSTLVAVPSVEGWPLRKAVQELLRRNLSFRLMGSQTVITQFPAPGTLVPVGTTCELRGVSG